MTKRELAEVEILKTRLALHFYPKVEPDIEIPVSISDGIKNGWMCNEYNRDVEKACTSSVNHGFGEWDKTNTQGPRRLYSTRKLAFAALLSFLAEKFAKELREVEKKTEQDSHN